MENMDLQKEFEAAAKPLMDFIRDNYHPNCTAIVTITSAEILEGQIAWYKADNCND